MRLIGRGSKRTVVFAWRRRAVQLALALAGTGLMTAIAAAAIGARQPISTEKAMAAAIVAQQIAEGQVPTPPPAPVPMESAPAPGSPGEAQARQAILDEAAQLEQQMTQTIDHVETLRTEAYKQKDMIRLNTVTTKLDEIKQIMSIAKDAFAALRVPGQDLFVMRAKLMTIRQGWDRMREALQAAESAEGDNVNTVLSGIGPENAQQGNSTGDYDVTGPGSPSSDQTSVIGERPANASPSK